MAITMQLGGQNIGQEFPRVSRTAEMIRYDDQGPAFKKVSIVLYGFLTGLNNAEVMNAFNALKANCATNSYTAFTYTDTDPLNGNATVTMYTNQQVYVAAYHEPDETEYAKCAYGDYSIELYYFEDTTSNLGVTCSYGSYTFPKLPRWGRRIVQNRETHRSKLVGSTASITLSGTLFASGSAALQQQLTALQTAFSSDQLLTYGQFSQNCHIVDVDIPPTVLMNYVPYQISLAYDIGQEVRLRRKLSFSRLHQNPIITEQPFCDRRLIQLMNFSAQTVTYRIQVAAQDITTARQILTTEATNLISPGGIELPGGTEEWDYDDVSVDVTIIKFYDPYVLDNLAGTGY